MKIDERNALMARIFERCLVLSKKKGKDYTGEDDSLANVRLFGVKGIIIRLFDKLYRLKSIEESGKIEVMDESVEDTFIDVIVYSALAMILRGYKGDVPVINEEGHSNEEVYPGQFINVIWNKKTKRYEDKNGNWVVGTVRG